MSSEELNKMSQKTRLQDLPSEEIEWKYEDMEKAILDNADLYDELLNKAGQEELPPQVAEDMWEMERKLWSQRQNTNDESSFKWLHSGDD